jgi:hypothetical protein
VATSAPKSINVLLEDIKLLLRLITRLEVLRATDESGGERIDELESVDLGKTESGEVCRLDAEASCTCVSVRGVSGM